MRVSDARSCKSRGASKGSRSIASIIPRQRVTACSRAEAAESSGESRTPTQLPRATATIVAIQTSFGGAPTAGPPRAGSVSLPSAQASSGAASGLSSASTPPAVARASRNAGRPARSRTAACLAAAWSGQTPGSSSDSSRARRSSPKSVSVASTSCISEPRPNTSRSPAKGWSLDLKRSLVVGSRSQAWARRASPRSWNRRAAAARSFASMTRACTTTKTTNPTASRPSVAPAQAPKWPHTRPPTRTSAERTIPSRTVPMARARPSSEATSRPRAFCPCS